MTGQEKIHFTLADGSRDCLNGALAAARRASTTKQAADGLWDASQSVAAADSDGSFFLTARDLYWIGKASRPEYWRDEMTMTYVMANVQGQFNAWSIGDTK
ncbi:hypothetical protein ABZ616_36535 [Streptomyces noursei]|uniref:hypothetical protein n=1 Tax=Streptomyces noursei TaxID=1971 RepID=UPI0033C12D48